MTGQLVGVYSLPGRDRLEIGLQDQPAGTYYLEFMTGDQRLGIQKVLLGN
jgi:hypothetical protein